MAKRTKVMQRKARHARIRKRVLGTTDRPRLSVFRSLKQVYAQVIDDTQGITLAAACSLEKPLSASGNVEGGKRIGAEIARRAKAKGISKVVFDRGGYRFTGVVAGIAEGAREGGLEF